MMVYHIIKVLTEVVCSQIVIRGNWVKEIKYIPVYLKLYLIIAPHDYA